MTTNGLTANVPESNGGKTMNEEFAFTNDRDIEPVKRRPTRGTNGAIIAAVICTGAGIVILGIAVAYLASSQKRQVANERPGWPVQPQEEAVSQPPAPTPSKYDKVKRGNTLTVSSKKGSNAVAFVSKDAYHEFVDDNGAMVHVAQGKVFLVENSTKVECLEFSPWSDLVKVKFLSGKRAETVGWLMIEDVSE